MEVQNRSTSRDSIPDVRYFHMPPPESQARQAINAFIKTTPTGLESGYHPRGIIPVEKVLPTVAACIVQLAQEWIQTPTGRAIVVAIMGAVPLIADLVRPRVRVKLLGCKRHRKPIATRKQLVVEA